MLFGYDIDTHLGLNVLIAVIAVLATIALAFFIFRSIKKEKKKFQEEAINYIDGLIQKNELIADVTTYISRSSAAEFSLIYIDLDKFSNIIDAFGKDEANNILSKVAYILVDNLPPRVELTRLQDDKFVAFARGEYRKDEVEEIALKLLEAISKPIKFFGDNEITITASIGIALYPSHGLTYKDLINDAEIAVYLCKREGGNAYKFYSLENMSESANLAYYQQIKKGIKNKEFTLYYQPMIDTNKKDIYAIEGLLRWNHPEYGVLSPFKFINIMEQTGDINWVGEWGLETLAKEQAYLARKYPNKTILMSMNLSPKQLASATIVENFTTIARKVKVNPKNIILEVEEFTLFEKHEAIKQNVANLSKAGFNIAVDGFSLDYSTLSKLASMPIDVVKVGNDFLDSENETFLKEKFVNMLVDYTMKENKTIVSEGIENFDMLVKAKDMNLGIQQGYYFAKPMDADDLDDYLDAEEWVGLIDSNKAKEENPFEEQTTEEQISDEVSTSEDQTSEEVPEAEQIVEDEKPTKKGKKSKKAKKEETPVEETPQIEEEQVSEEASVEEEQPIAEEPVADEEQHAEEEQTSGDVSEDVPAEEVSEEAQTSDDAQTSEEQTSEDVVEEEKESNE